MVCFTCFRRWGPLLGTAAVLSACESPTAPQEGEVALTASLSSSSFTLGDQLDIILTVSNLTDRQLVYTTGGCQFLMRLVGSSETSYISGNLCQLELNHHTLRPREESVRVWPFSGWVYSSSGDLHMAEPGSYTLEAQLNAEEVTPRAEPLTLLIEPASP